MKPPKGKRYSRKQVAQMKATKRSRTFANPASVQVGTIRESGGKRKGKAMKRPSTLFRNGTVTRPMLDNAPTDAMAHVNSRGAVKRLDYRRD